MNWKSLIFRFIVFAVFMFAIFFSIGHKNLGSNYTSRDYAQDALSAIALSLGSIGDDQLKQLESRKIRHILLGCALVWFVVCSFFLFILERPLRGPVFEGFFGGILFLIAAQFPLAVYLNRKQNKSNSQPTIADAS